MTTAARHCAWCNGSCSSGWIVIRQESFGRIVTICQACWQGAEQPRILEALGNGTAASDSVR